MKKHFKTLIISDVHLGISSSKAKEAAHFLKNTSCDRLILNGDIIDGWQLKRSGKWKKRHTRFFKVVMNYVTKRKCEVIYLRGNHDDFLDEFIPFKMKRFFITDKYVLESQNKKYLVIHGDIFDSITSNLKWISRLGDVGYTFLLWLNRYYNQYRVKRGLPYYSLSQKIKAKVKSAVNFISDFETKLSKLAEDYKYDGIICGHIHQPANKMMNGIHYLNSGDWVETLSALAEDQEGNWSVIYYEDWLKEFQQTNETLTFTLNFSETNPPSGLINLGI